MDRRTVKKKSMAFLCFLCCLTYFTSYLMRLNYSSSLIEIQNALQITKSQAGLPVTGCFFVYGAGQLVWGFWGDKTAPYKIIFAGLLGTAVCNLLIAMIPNITAITLIWCVNGFFQSMFWPPLVRIMAELLTETWYHRCSVLVSFAASFGTIAVYLLAPVCLSLWGWKSVFLLPSAAGFLTAFYWLYHMWGQGENSSARASSVPLPNQKETGGGLAHIFCAAPLIPLLLVIALHGVLKDGITTWMPAYMADTFRMSNSMSILITALLPVFSIFSTLLASVLSYWLKDELYMAALLFGASFISGCLMLPANGRSLVGCCVLMMIITGCMFGVNLMLISRLPRHFSRFGMVSTISGILNAATYAGSSLSTYSFGRVAESGGWKCVIYVWLGVSVGAFLLLLGSIRKWKRFCAGG